MLKAESKKYEHNGTYPQHIVIKRLTRVFFERPLVVHGAIIIGPAIITASFAPLLAPYDPYEINLRHVLKNPSAKHLLGTDSLGRDTLSRIIYGTRTSLIVGVLVILFASTVGVTLGLIAGYFGGAINSIIMRFIDALMCFPWILQALAISVLLGSGLKNVIIALGVGMVTIYARLMCGQVLVVKQTDYILSSKTIGSSSLRILLLHVLPNTLPPLIIVMTMMLGTAILAEAGLSFLGLGIAPPGASLGGMVNEGYPYIARNPMLSFTPGLIVMALVFGANMVGDGLRDALDPRLRGVI